MIREYRADIDGLRAVAVAAVVGFHAFPTVIPGGFVGVDVFFVISGYLITDLILGRQRNGDLSIKEFYVGRARRILPSLTIVIAATLVIGWFLLLPAPYEKLGLHSLAGALFFPNLIYWSEAGYFDAAAKAKPLLHLWSLGVEEQFYLVWPLLLLFLLRHWKEWLAIVLLVLAALSLIYSSIEAFYDPTAAFYSPLSRLWELGLGSILASWHFKLPCPKTASLVGLSLIVGAALKLTNASPFPGLLALIPVAGAGLVIASGSWILSRRPLVALGLISYPLYLWHWPLLSFAAVSSVDTDITKTMILAGSVCLAWLTARFIEYPIRFGGLRYRGATISTSAIIGTSLVAATVIYSGGLPTRYAPEIRPVLATMKYEFKDAARVGRCWIPPNVRFESYAQECRTGDIWTWGDSYSGLLSTGLPRPHGQFTLNGCLPLLTSSTDVCAINGLIIDEILRVKPKRVILFGAWLFQSTNWQSDTRFNEALRQTLHKLRGRIDDIVLIGPSPYWPPSLPYVVFKFWSDFRILPDRVKVPPEAYRATDAIFREIAAGENVRFVSIFDALCNADGCLSHTPVSRSELLAWDDGHMTIEGARYVVEKLGLDRFDRVGVQHGGH